MFQTFLTGLREGLEAALVVSILLTFLVRGGHRDRIPALWAGVAVAVVLSFGFGGLLHFTSVNMSFEAREAFGGILSIIAVGFVTWMVFWMRRAAHTLKGDLHGKMQTAVDLGATAVGLAALVAVGREGLETALFMYPTFQAQGAGAGPALGAVLGILTAVLIGVLLYEGAVHMNLAHFFRFTGAALIVIAAGVLAYGVHDLQEAGILPGLDNLALEHRGLRGHQLVRNAGQGHLQSWSSDDGSRSVRVRRLPRPDHDSLPATGPCESRRPFRRSGRIRGVRAEPNR